MLDSRDHLAPGRSDVFDEATGGLVQVVNRPFHPRSELPTRLDETICGEGLLFDREIVSLLTRLGRRGVTIILAAPNPVELHRITARVINLVEGRIVAPSRYPLKLDPRDAELAFDLPTPKRVAEQEGLREKS